MINLIQKAKDFAIESHSQVNHIYDNKPYSIHLQLVVNNLIKFSKYIHEDYYEEVLAAGWMHDVIEDTRKTYNDIESKFGCFIADIVYALTNEKGKNRQERANSKYYRGIRDTKYATLIKLCDRIANVEYAKSKKSRMFDVYKKENDHFIKSLKKGFLEKIFGPIEPDYVDVKNYLNNLFI